MNTDIVVNEQQIQIEYVSTDELKFAPFNPRSRTEKRRLAKLRMAIEAAGRILVPLLITSDNYVADGHRRLTIAAELGIKSVPVIRYDMALADLWSNANQGTLSPTSITWVQAVRNGLTIDSVPDKERRQINELLRIMGRRGFEKLADAGRSTYILTMAKSVASYCGDDSDKFIKQTILWFEECQQQFAVRRAIAEKCLPEVLLSAIKETRPIRQYWGVA